MDTGKFACNQAGCRFDYGSYIAICLPELNDLQPHLLLLFNTYSYHSPLQTSTTATMQKTPPTQASKPTATAEPLYTQALLQQAGALDFSLPNPPSLPVVTQDMILAMGADEMRRRLLPLIAGEAGRLPQGNASPLDYVSETESEEEPTPYRPAARV